MRIATVGEVTDRQTNRRTDRHTDVSDFIICPMLGYSNGTDNKKLSYCWETVRRESMPRIAEMDVEMTI